MHTNRLYRAQFTAERNVHFTSRASGHQWAISKVFEESKVTCRFSTVWGISTPKPCMVQMSTVQLSHSIHNMKTVSEFWKKTVWSNREMSGYAWYQDSQCWSSLPRRSASLIKRWEVIIFKTRGYSGKFRSPREMGSIEKISVQCSRNL